MTADAIDETGVGRNLRTFADWLILFLLGAVSILLQVTLIRQVLALLSGNEIEIGITLSVWLLSYGLGSLAGAGVPFSRSLLAVCLGTAGTLLLPTLYLIKDFRTLLDYQPGELLSLSDALLTTFLSIGPLAFVMGFQYPLAVGLIKGSGNYGSRVYVLETSGFFFGGLLFAFVISTRMDGLLLGAGLSAVLCAMASLVSKRAVILLWGLVPVGLYLAGGAYFREVPFRPFPLEAFQESRYGELALVRAGEQNSLFRSGQYLYSFPDPETDEVYVHLAMSLHTAPEDVLVMGEAPHRIEEYLKYGIRKETYLLEDDALLPLILEHAGAGLGRALQDPRLSVLHREGRAYLRSAKTASVDLLVLDMAPPTTAASNRFFTTEFFVMAKRLLRPSGLLVLKGLTGHGYLSPSAESLNRSIRAALEYSFAHVVASSTAYGIFAASDEPLETDPAEMARRFRSRGIATGFFEPYLFTDAFPPYDTRPAEGADGASGSLEPRMNQDSRPVAYMFNLLHWAEVQGSRVFAGIAGLKPRHLALFFGSLTLAGVFYSVRVRNRAIYLNAVATGFVSISVSTALILGFQSLFGHAYEAIAMLTACFMFGASAGAWAGMRILSARRVYAGLVVDAGLFLTAVLLAPILLKHELSFFVASMIAGGFTGAVYSLSVRALGEEEETRPAAFLYGADMVGAGAGALICATLIVPIAGIDRTFDLLALLQLGATVALFRHLRGAS